MKLFHRFKPGETFWVVEDRVISRKTVRAVMFNVEADKYTVKYLPDYSEDEMYKSVNEILKSF